MEALLDLIDSEVIEYDEIENEMIEGQFVEEEMATARHTEIINNISWALNNFVRINELGKVYPEGNIILEPKVNLPKPDIAFFSFEKLSALKKYLETPPDLIVEVVSPTSYQRDTETKFELYQRFGVKEYWIVFPVVESVHVFTLVEGKYEIYSVGWKNVPVQSAMFPQFSPTWKEIFG